MCSCCKSKHKALCQECVLPEQHKLKQVKTMRCECAAGDRAGDAESPSLVVERSTGSVRESYKSIDYS